MSHPVLDSYLETIGPEWEPLVRGVDEAVRASGAPFDIAVKYRMLMYTLDKDWRHWVCAISVTKNAVNLRFLYGVWMRDPGGVLRSGSSTLMTLDIASSEELDSALVTSYVEEAVSLHDRYGWESPASAPPAADD